MTHDPEERAANQLLRLMRDPASIITAIREELTLDHEEVRRNVEITLRPARKGS